MKFNLITLSDGIKTKTINLFSKDSILTKILAYIILFFMVLPMVLVIMCIAGCIVLLISIIISIICIWRIIDYCIIDRFRKKSKWIQ